MLPVEGRGLELFQLDSKAPARRPRGAQARAGACQAVRQAASPRSSPGTTKARVLVQLSFLLAARLVILVRDFHLARKQTPVVSPKIV